jgi:hypothetical protein
VLFQVLSGGFATERPVRLASTYLPELNT